MEMAMAVKIGLVFHVFELNSSGAPSELPGDPQTKSRPPQCNPTTPPPWTWLQGKATRI